MSIQNFNVVVDSGCNAHCPFCISRLTPKCEASPNWSRKFDKACDYAVKQGCVTAMITGKGEPTVDMDKCLDVTKRLSKWFPIIELQTNGILLNESAIFKLSNAGVTTISVSAISSDTDANRKVISSKYRDLNQIAENCEKHGILSRLSIVMTSDYFADLSDAVKEINNTKKLGFRQLTIRRMGAPDNVLFEGFSKKEKDVYNWIKEHDVWFTPDQLSRWLNERGRLIQRFPWGADVYALNGISVCLTSCLSSAKNGCYRYVIYHPDGFLRYLWEEEASIIM